MLGSFFKAFSVPEVRDRILWLFGGFAIFALAVHVPIPGVNRTVWHELLAQGQLFQLLGMFTGGALNKFSIAAMGITPYINASIIMQLLTVVIPQLKDLQKEGGEHGRRKLGAWTRQLTMVLAVLQGSMMVTSLHSLKTRSVFVSDSPFYLVMVVTALVGGTAFLMWLGELMSDKGIGNGVSLLIFAGIVMSYPRYVHDAIVSAMGQGVRSGVIPLIFFFLVAFVLVCSIVAITLGQRKVPVQYPKRQVGRKVYGGQSSYIPIRVNNSGVISLIFAISIMFLPATLAGFIPGEVGATMKDFLVSYFHERTIQYNLVYMGLVIFFTYFYSAITFNVEDLADNLKKAGGFIPGIRPGRPTAEYLDKILNRLNLVAGIYLATLAVAPTLVMRLTGVTSFYLGATSLLIIVGVALDTMQQIEARLVMRHYQGFMK
ncbi:MAG: preprotein translocase subunit SecY [Vulcanimicrobiota bacterium]